MQFYELFLCLFYRLDSLTLLKIEKRIYKEWCRSRSRNSRLPVLYIEAVLKNVTKFTGKHYLFNQGFCKCHGYQWYIEDLLKHLRWSVLRFVQSTLCQMFHWVLNTPMRILLVFSNIKNTQYKIKDKHLILFILYEWRLLSIILNLNQLSSKKCFAPST